MKLGNFGENYSRSKVFKIQIQISRYRFLLNLRLEQSIRRKYPFFILFPRSVGRRLNISDYKSLIFIILIISLFLFIQISYGVTKSQLKYLRLNADVVRQNITYNCHNTHAHRNEAGDLETFIKIQTSKKQITLTTQNDKKKRKLTNLKDGCAKRKERWDEATFALETSDDMGLLPMLDIGVRGSSSQGGYFKVKLGPVCFT